MYRSTSRLGAIPFCLTPMLALFAACSEGDTDVARVTFTQPAEDATLAGGVNVEMEATDITIEEAGDVHDNAGHFHVIADEGCIAPGEAMPRDADHLHFGAGQGEGSIYLEPGTHELCLQAGDGAHTALDATDTVTVTVAITSVDEWCGVVGEVEELFDATDAADEPFATKQIGYENIRRLFAQLSAGVNHLDAGVREAVGSDIAYGTSIATAFIEAADPADADAALAQIDQDPLVADGVQAVSDTCEVDLGG